MRLDFEAPAPELGKDREAWQQNIATAAQATMMNEEWETGVGPITIYASFRLPRPKSMKKGYVPHQVQPDLLTLQKALLEGLRNIVFLKDSQVIDMEVHKAYAEAELRPCVYITVGGP